MKQRGKKGKIIKRNEHNLRDLWDNVKCPNIRIIEVPEKEEKKKKELKEIRTTSKTPGTMLNVPIFKS